MKYKNFFLRAVNLLLILGVLRYFWLFSLSFRSSAPTGLSCCAD